MVGHVHGHQCHAVGPVLLAAHGGLAAACRHYCRVTLDLEPGAQTAVARWRGEQDWVEREVRTTYTARWAQVRPHMSATVSLTAIVAVAAAMAAHADHDTGRNSRPAVATLASATALSERTVQRAREALRRLGLATEALRGRLRTRAERMASWRVGDQARGWTSVYALHPRRPVDKTRDENGNPVRLTPHPRRGRFYPETSRQRELSTDTPVENRAAPRRHDQGAQISPVARRDRDGLLLAVRWLKTGRAPLWAAEITVERWSRVLGDAGRHGWTGDDINRTLNDEARRIGRELTPTNPIGFVRWLLARVDLAYPPHLLDDIARAQDAELRAHEAATRAAQRERAVADLDGPGRRQALDVVRAIARRSGRPRRPSNSN